MTTVVIGNSGSGNSNNEETTEEREVNNNNEETLIGAEIDALFSTIFAQLCKYLNSIALPLDFK